jgi:hypothetical protein
LQNVFGPERKLRLPLPEGVIDPFPPIMFVLGSFQPVMKLLEYQRFVEPDLSGKARYDYERFFVD